MNFSATQIAFIVNGTIEGNTNVTVNNFGKIEHAVKGELSFLANPKYEEFIYTTQASIILLNQKFKLKKQIQSTIIRVPDAYVAFATLLSHYQLLKQQKLTGFQQPIFIHENTKIGEQVFIGAFSYISSQVFIGNNTKIYPQVFIGENVTIGSNCIFYPGVKIYADCKLGNNIILHAGCVIGSDGFGFAPKDTGVFEKIPQIGNVVIEDDVEIGANTTIDRATIGSTLIKKGVKLDNLVQIAHNVEINNNTVIAAQAGISGSTKIGKQVMIGGQAGFAGHITVGDGAKVNGQSGVTKSLMAGKSVTGTPAYDFTAVMRNTVSLKNIAQLEARVKCLEDILKKIHP